MKFGRLVMTSKSKTKDWASGSVAAQLDVLAGKQCPYCWTSAHKEEGSTAEVEELLESLLTRLKANEELSSDEVKKYDERISTIRKYLQRQQEKLERKPFGANRGVAFRILPAKSPQEHLARAKVRLDGRFGDWEKVSNDLRLAYLKTLSEILSAQVRIRKISASKHAG